MRKSPARRGGGSSIYLGKPVATPPGIFIGFPGPTIFFQSHQADTAAGMVVDFTGNFILDLTTQEALLD